MGQWPSEGYEVKNMQEVDADYTRALLTVKSR